MVGPMPPAASKTYSVVSDTLTVWRCGSPEAAVLPGVAEELNFVRAAERLHIAAAGALPPDPGPSNQT